MLIVKGRGACVQVTIKAHERRAATIIPIAVAAIPVEIEEGLSRTAQVPCKATIKTD